MVTIKFKIAHADFILLNNDALENKMIKSENHTALLITLVWNGKVFFPWWVWKADL